MSVTVILMKPSVLIAVVKDSQEWAGMGGILRFYNQTLIAGQVAAHRRSMENCEFVLQVGSVYMST